MLRWLVVVCFFRLVDSVNFFPEALACQQLLQFPLFQPEYRSEEEQGQGSGKEANENHTDGRESGWLLNRQTSQQARLQDDNKTVRFVHRMQEKCSVVITSPASSKNLWLLMAIEVGPSLPRVITIQSPFVGQTCTSGCTLIGLEEAVSF